MDTNIVDSDGAIAQLITNEEDLDFSKDICLFGGRQHKRFIKNKIKTCQNSEKEIFEKQLLSLEDTEINHGTFEAFGKLPKLKVIKFGQIPRQFILDGILHREEEERKASWMELFFDLVFVGVIGQLSHTVQHDLVFHHIWEYFIKFGIIWRVWSMQTSFVNRFLRQDLYAKMYLLTVATIAVCLSLSLNDLHAGIPTTFIVFYLLNDLVSIFCQMGLGLFKIQFLLDLTCFNITSVITAIPAILALSYEHDSRNIFLSINILMSNFVFLPLNGFFARIFKPKYRIALNIEHWCERYGAFTIIVLGESVIAILNGASTFNGYFCSVCGLIVAASVQWIYFDVDSAKQYMHAIRRNRYSGLIWYSLHLPFHAMIAFSGACLGLLIQDTHEEHKYSKNAQSGYITSVGLTLLIMGVIGLTHKDLDKQENRILNISKTVRKAIRFFVSIVLIVVGFVSPSFRFAPTWNIGFLALLAIVLIGLEEYGKLETCKSKR